MMSAHGLLQPRRWLAGLKIDQADDHLRERIIEFAAERHRFDYWRLHAPGKLAGQSQDGAIVLP